MARRHRLRVPGRATVCALAACALLAAARGPGTAAAAPAAGERLGVTGERLDAISARLLAVRTRLQNAGPAEEQRLLQLQSRLERQKRVLAEREDRLAVQATIERRRTLARRAAERRAAAEPAASAPPVAAVPPPARVPVPAVAAAQGDAELAAALDGYLAGKLSPLTGLGGALVSAARGAGLDPRLLVAISGAETGFGTYAPAQRIHNPFGLGPHVAYPSWEASIAAAARTLGGPIYRGAGRTTIARIQERWAPIGAGNDPTGLNANWVANVARYYAELGGDPNGPVFTAPAGVRQAAELGAPAPAPPLAQGPAVAVRGGGSGAGPLVARDALRYLGTPYLWGGESPETGFDCSGFVQYLYGRRGVALPRVAEDQAAVGIPVRPEELRAGDAIFFADATGYVHHEGLYLGDGYFVHAPRTGDVVKISSLYEPYYARQYAGARRY